MARTAATAHPSTDRAGLRFLVIGAGMSGILSAIKLREAGYHDFEIYEKTDRLGGTWRENTYAGVGCDVPSHLYSYSFALNPDWSHRFSPGGEIQAYFEDVARRYGVDRVIRYGQEVRRCAFENGRWHLDLSDGSRDVGDVVIAATGVLHHPAYPDIPGLDSFAGVSFHTARWNHAVPLAGQRVGIIGTGSTAVQIVPSVIGDVAKLSLFQRTAQWVVPQDNPAYTEDEKAAFRRHPETMKQLRADISRMFADMFSNAVVDASSPQLQAIHAACVANLESQVRDPVLREKLRPDYRAGCKRLVMSADFYQAIQRPNAELVTEGIERIEPSGVRTRDGRLHELDVLILATGFRVDRFMRPMEVVGRDGLALEEAWRKGPIAYMAISIPDFPNLFMLNGPNGPVGNFSLIEVAELQLGYALQLVDRIRAGECREVSASREATARFDAERRQATRKTIWASGCRSWYLDAEGVPAVWPWSFDRLREEMATPRIADFELR